MILWKMVKERSETNNDSEISRIQGEDLGMMLTMIGDTKREAMFGTKKKIIEEHQTKSDEFVDLMMQ